MRRSANFGLQDFTYDNNELTLIKLIQNNQANEAADYVARYPILMHDFQVFNPSSSISTSPGPLALQVGKNHREIIIINPDKYGVIPAANLPYDGKAHIFSQDKDRKSAIHFAAQKRMISVVRNLVKSAVASGLPDYINIKDGFGRTALHYAAIAGDEEMIIFLIKNGADTREQEISKGMYPSEFLSPSKTYRTRTLELISGASSASIPMPLEQNPIYQEILAGNEIRAKDLAFDPKFFAQKDLLIAKARELGKNNLANFLGLIADLHNLNKKYQISLLQNFSSQEEKDNFYLNLLKENIDLFLKYNQTEEHRQYNEVVNRNLMRVIGSCTHMISFKFKEQSQNIIPWQNIVSLRYFGEISQNNGFNLLFKRQLQALHQAFTNLRPNLELMSDGNFFGPLLPNARIAGLEGIDLTTDLVNDIRTLNKIADFGKIVDGLDPKLPYSEDRLALIAMMKQLGEFSKNSEQCNNMSRVAKGQLDNVPWRILGTLRDYVAKAPTRQKEYSVYDQLLTSNTLETESFLLKIRADIADISFKASEAYNAMMQDISTHGWDATLTKYQNQSEIELSAQQQNELVTDLRSEAASEVRAAPKKRKEKLASDVEKYFSNDPSSEIKSFEKLRETVKEVAFNEPIFAALKSKWRDILDNRNGDFPALEECHDRFKDSTATGAINYQARASLVLNKLMEIIIGDQTIINKLKQNHDLTQSDEVQKHLFARLETYDKSPIKVLAVEQLYSELWLVMNKMPANMRLNEESTRLRNFIEHKNNIFDYVDRDLQRANFLEFIGIILNTNEKINPQAATVNPATSPAQPTVLGHTNPEVIALGWH